MTGEWAVRLPLAKSASAARLRLVAGILVARQGEYFWLRGKSPGGGPAKPISANAGSEILRRAGSSPEENRLFGIPQNRRSESRQTSSPGTPGEGRGGSSASGSILQNAPSTVARIGELPAGEELELELRKLPGAERFSLNDDGTLTPAGSRLATGKLPDLPWTPIATWFVPASSPAAFRGQVDHRIALKLVRSGDESPASVLMTTCAQWLAYAGSAPLVRLKAIRFAADQSGRALLRGIPLPPIPGSRFVERDGIAIPLGLAISPAIDSATLRELLGVSAQDLALFREDGSVEIIAGREFQNATRASARATAEKLRQGVGPRP